MPVIKKSFRNVLAQSRKHTARKRKQTKKNNKKCKASRKSKILYGGSEHINQPSRDIAKRMESRQKQLLQIGKLQQVQTQAQLQEQQSPVQSISSSLNIMRKLKNVLMRK
jgi:hypothetical protein